MTILWPNWYAYDLERYTAIRQIVAEMLAAGSGHAPAVIVGLLEQEQDYATSRVGRVTPAIK